MIDSRALLCVDMGTTRTRVWVYQKDHIWAHTAKDFGVRDVARGTTREALSKQLSELITDTLDLARAAGLADMPTSIAAAGMITSPLGLVNLPHISVPAGPSEIAEAIKSVRLNSGLSRPLYLVPGLVTGNGKGSTTEVLASDVMRGEEVLVIGMLMRGLLSPGGAVLNLGSHWKLIQTNMDGRITGSHTSLTGEMIHAVHTQTLLTSALPQERPENLNAGWLSIGAKEESRSGLSRALFCVRLLEQSGETTTQQRISFLYGAFIEAELRSLLRLMRSTQVGPICLVGGQAVARAWHERLTAATIPSLIVGEAERDSCYLAGLLELVSRKQASS